MKDVCIISNQRMLFLYLLLNFDKVKDTFFIFDKNVHFSQKSFPIHIKVSQSSSLLNLLFKSFYYNFLFFFMFRWKNISKIYGADHITGATYFLKRYPFYLIEDGTINHNPNSYRRSWKNRLFSIPKWGVYHNVKKMYLTSLDGVPYSIINKVEVIDLKELWRNAPKVRQEQILNALGIDLNKLLMFGNKKCILYTQPLSEDGIITEEEKIHIYKNIVDSLSYGADDILIKPHPREITDYSRYFSNIDIFEDKIPAELFVLLLPNIEYAITLFSTAVYEYPKDKVLFFGTEIHPKLEKHFGKINF